MMRRVLLPPWNKLVLIYVKVGVPSVSWSIHFY